MKIPDGLSMMISCGGRSLWHVHTELFGVDEYLKLSEESFSRVWYGSKKVGDTGSYDKENGGMFWQWQPIHNPKPNRPGDGKMACINFPYRGSSAYTVQ